MKLSKEKGLFLFRCGYSERTIPKDAGFRWHANNHCIRKGCKMCEAGLSGAWWTDDSDTAIRLFAYADESCRGELESAHSHLQETIRQSHSQNADLSIPAPKNLCYLPYQRAGVAFAASRPHTLIGDGDGLEDDESKPF